MRSPSLKLSRVLLSPAAWEKMAFTRMRPLRSRPAAMELERGRVLFSAAGNNRAGVRGISVPSREGRSHPPISSAVTVRYSEPPGGPGGGRSTLMDDCQAFRAVWLRLRKELGAGVRVDAASDLPLLSWGSSLGLRPQLSHLLMGRPHRPRPTGGAAGGGVPAMADGLEAGPGMVPRSARCSQCPSQALVTG